MIMEYVLTRIFDSLRVTLSPIPCGPDWLAMCGIIHFGMRPGFERKIVAAAIRGGEVPVILGTPLLQAWITSDRFS